MKKLYALSIIVSAVAFVVLMASFGGDSGSKYPAGAPPGYTNSPADGMNCSHCMGGTAMSVVDWITSDIPPTGYVPGATYIITVTGFGQGNKGFELSPQDVSGNLIGMLSAGTGSQLVGGDKYVTHTAASSANPSSWTFPWTAPMPGVGDVTFYASVIVGKLNTNTTSFTYNQSTVGLNEPELMSLSVYPNPVKDQINLSYNLLQTGMVTVDLLSVTGRNVASLVSDMRQAGENLEVLRIDISSGIYLLRIQADGEIQVRKIVVQ